MTIKTPAVFYGLIAFVWLVNAMKYSSPGYYAIAIFFFALFVLYWKTAKESK